MPLTPAPSPQDAPWTPTGPGAFKPTESARRKKRAKASPPLMPPPGEPPTTPLQDAAVYVSRSVQRWQKSSRRQEERELVAELAGSDPDVSPRAWR